ncbi:hypothetical protein [Photobacterium phosphoreum]|uniref:hypothetical protein n=1 Tax=Photobacterium phosphoreum TaxID=659 RepID=UPI001EFC5A95|nr:hypothetical protein [Photobacterium phosphoreum]
MQISLAGREVGSESVGNTGYANKGLSSRDGQQKQATALRAPCATHISRANQRKAFIFRKAWALAAMKALRFGGLKCTYFAACLKVAYRQCAADFEQQLSRYKALMLENKKYLTELKNQLICYENKNYLLNQKEVLTNLSIRIRQGEIRQSYFIDLLFGQGGNEYDDCK